MKELFAYTESWLSQHNGYATASEIISQPYLWKTLFQQLQQSEQQWRAFLTPLLNDPDINIILTGAGSSDFVGKALVPWLREKTGLNLFSYGTTDIVSTPLQCFSPHKKTLLISFARSGNSPESLATVELADQLINECYHLMITCNPEGNLAQYAHGKDHVFSLIMPEGSNDKSFAMTSSFTCMAMTAVLLLGFNDLQQAFSSLEKLISLCIEQQDQWQYVTKMLSKQSYKRIVYLGSSCFKGISEESALKTLELTAGKIMTRFDSSLGFRHGPKFTIDADTLAICLLSNDPYIRQYDIDLFNEIKSNGLAKKVLALSGHPFNQGGVISLNSDLSDIWLTFAYLLFSQMLAFENSLALGLGPDNPCPSGEVNRVVKGVTIYPFNH